MQTSIFSEYLAALLKHSLILDSAGEAKERFIDLQHLEERIVAAHSSGYLNETESRALYAIAMRLHSDYRQALNLDRMEA